MSANVVVLASNHFLFGDSCIGIIPFFEGGKLMGERAIGHTFTFHNAGIGKPFIHISFNYFINIAVCNIPFGK